MHKEQETVKIELLLPIFQAIRTNLEEDGRRKREAEQKDRRTGIWDIINPFRNKLKEEITTLHKEQETVKRELLLPIFQAIGTNVINPFRNKLGQPYFSSSAKIKEEGKEEGT